MSYSFERRPNAVSAKSRIDWSDFGRMYVDYRAVQRIRQNDTPEWTANNELLRIAVINALERRMYLNTTGTWAERLEQINAAAARWVPEKQDTLRYLLSEYTTASPDRQRALEKQIVNLDTDLVLTARGYAAIILAVVYYFWRLGHDGTQIAEALSLKSAHVRQILNRVRRGAAAAPKFLPRTPKRRARYEKLRARKRAEQQRRERIKSAWAAGKYKDRPKLLGNRNAAGKRSPEMRAKQSKIMKAAWAAGKYKDRPAKQSAALKAAWARGAYANRKRKD